MDGAILIGFDVGVGKAGKDEVVYTLRAVFLSTEGEFLGEDVTSFQPGPMFRGQQMQPVSHDILKFRVWTGTSAFITTSSSTGCRRKCVRSGRALR